MKQLVFALLAIAGCASAAEAPRFIYSPYKHLAQSAPYIVDGKRVIAPGALTWAFASGECGAERWGEETAEQIATANVAAFNAAGVDYLVSTGGQGAVFTCATDEGMEAFIRRYESQRLIGFDFDIEEGQTPEQLDSLIRRIKAAQTKRPHLRYSFTVATHAASDGSGKSLNKQGETVLATLRRHDVRGFTLNLMVMDYGPGEPASCVVNKAGHCDMGKSAIQAAQSVHRKYKVPYAQIELTPMIGVNDVISNVFTLDDARMLGKAVKSMKLAGLHFWSFDRDKPCAKPETGAVAVCSTTPSEPMAYHKAFTAP